MKKTNKQWYPSKPDANYYRLVDGVLLACAMNADGTRDPEVVEVDPDMFTLDTRPIQIDSKTVTTAKYLTAIMEELNNKE